MVSFSENLLFSKFYIIHHISTEKSTLEKVKNLFKNKNGKVLKLENDLGSGIKEPLPLEVKDTRTGLGHDREVEEKSKQRLVQEMERMKHRAKHHVRRFLI